MEAVGYDLYCKMLNEAVRLLKGEIKEEDFTTTMAVSYTHLDVYKRQVQEIADEIGISKEDIVFALDAIQVPMSLQEPVYNDGGDALYVMDQLSDSKNREDK